MNYVRQRIKKMFEQNGWVCDRIKGSHHIRIKKGKRSVPIPIHSNKDLPKSLEKTIMKQAEIKTLKNNNA